MGKSMIAALVWAFLGIGAPAWAQPRQVTGGKLIGSDSSVADFAIDLSGDTLSGIVGGADVPHGVCEPDSN